MYWLRKKFEKEAQKDPWAAYAVMYVIAMFMLIGALGQFGELVNVRQGDTQYRDGVIVAAQETKRTSQFKWQARIKIRYSKSDAPIYTIDTSWKFGSIGQIVENAQAHIGTPVRVTYIERGGSKQIISIQTADSYEIVSKQHTLDTMRFTMFGMLAGCVFFVALGLVGHVTLLRRKRAREAAIAEEA